MSARDMTLPPPAEPGDGPQMSKWISRKEFWVDQRNILERMTIWEEEPTAEQLDMWQNDPEAWFAEYEPRREDSFGSYEHHLLYINDLHHGTDAEIWDDDWIL